MTFAYQTTKYAVNLFTKLIKADIRVHNDDVIADDMAIIFVSNHFTRSETLLLPWVIEKHTGRECYSLASDDLFAGALGDFLRGVGCVSTKDPDRDKTIIRELLTGDHPWIIFPEGAMIKDKKVVNPDGDFEIYHQGKRRQPFRGAGVLAIQAEFHRLTLKRLRDTKDEDGLREWRTRFGIESIDVVLRRRTVIVPINITYFPIRAGETMALTLAHKMNEKLSARAEEELSIEGGLLGGTCDIDITFGEPIEIRSYLESPEFQAALDESAEEIDEEIDAEAPEDRAMIGRAAESLMRRYMADIYRLTTINHDHIFATLIRYQRDRRFTERAYRNRIFLAVKRILDLKSHRVHTLLAKNYRELIYEEASPKFDDFIRLCLQEGILFREGASYVHQEPPVEDGAHFHTIRLNELTSVIANELEPLRDATRIIREVAEADRPALSAEVREIFLREEQEIFEEEYARFYEEGVSKPKDVGRPYLLLPSGKINAGIVLVHGYLAAPMETRALGEDLCGRGFAVYGVRLKGHGTAPEALAEANWEEWRESVNRGYAVIKSLTDEIILGGFSTGGCLAMLAAGRKGRKIRAVFSINAPLHLRNYAVHMIPSVNVVNTLMARVKRRRKQWEYLENTPENPHINYSRNPVASVKQLNECIREMERWLPEIKAPALVIQGSEDPIVDPVSAQLIFQALQSPHKELTYFARDRHGIINGDGAEDIAERAHQFLKWARVKTTFFEQEEAEEIIADAEAARGRAAPGAEAPRPAPPPPPEPRPVGWVSEPIDGVETVDGDQGPLLTGLSRFSLQHALDLIQSVESGEEENGDSENGNGSNHDDESGVE